MKYSVFSVMAHDQSPEELLPIMKEAGYQAVEWRFKETPESVKQEQTSFWGNNKCTIDPGASDDQLAKLKQLTAEYGIETLSVTPYLTDDLEETERVLKVASKLDASFIRLGVPKYNREENFQELFENARQYMKEAEKLCSKYGVKGLIETHHNTIATSASAAFRLLEGLDSKYVGVLYDPGNMVHEGYENHLLGMQLLGDYLAHIHMKNAIWVKDAETDSGEVKWQVDWAPVEKGIVDWQQVIKDLKSVGYDGYIGIEDFSNQYDTATALGHNYKWLEKWTQQF
ncbi:sugar phosphate isomerase/epimerase family protein [Gracilibacillus massiliensis]|uniref:sugar phosphate isomerase/epimerase family protein n=1 Tax=Gracilibacillus massiliensis TaxID=1564956 RepID=UPI00071DDCB6|nr:sugar phosphate isomerase/epimerase family protein [Gracilibacillus massiliensis]